MECYLRLTGSACGLQGRYNVLDFELILQEDAYGRDEAPWKGGKGLCWGNLRFDFHMGTVQLRRRGIGLG
jgi:hypothetical protein